MSLRTELLSLLQTDEEFRHEVAELLLPSFELSTRVEGSISYGSNGRYLEVKLSARDAEITDSVSVSDLN